MNETLVAMVGLVVVMGIAGRQIIRRNQDLEAENAAYKKTNANLLNGVMMLKQRCTWLEAELMLDEDAEAQEAETP